MDDSTSKPDTSDQGVKAQQALGSGDDAVLEMNLLDEISAGNSSLSDELVVFGIRRVEGEMQQAARDAYRKAHPYAHPDAVENAIKATFSTIGLEGKSGA